MTGLITAQDVAELLNVRASTVYEWARFGYIPTVRLETDKTKPCVRFERDAIVEWVKARSKTARK